MQHFTELRPDRRHLLWLVVLAVALYVLVPQIGEFRSSWRLLRHPLPAYTMAAIGLTFATYMAASATYCLLAFRPLKFGRTLLVQLAAMFINRLLPAGVGALGSNYLYLRHEDHNQAQATTAVAINNLWGFLGHSVLLILVFTAFPGQPLVTNGAHTDILGVMLKLILLGIVLLLILGLIFGRQRLRQPLDDIGQQLRSYRRRLWSLFAALLSSMALTLCNILCLVCCLLALGVHLPFIAVLLVFSFGVGAGAATPTPGGLGGFEAGLVAGFVAYGVSTTLALAAALLYRLISYWLPLVFGALAFAVCQHRKLFEPVHEKI